MSAAPGRAPTAGPAAMRAPSRTRWAFCGDAEDTGHFGPDSIAWRVFATPAVSLMIAQITNLLEVPHIDFQSVLLDHDPLYPTNAACQRTPGGGVNGRYHDRIGRTVAVPLPILFGDRRSAELGARRLFNYHRPMHGVNGDSGEPYAATDPAAMLFASVTIGHGALLAYERFAFDGLRLPRRLPAADRDRYFAEMAELAVLMGVPRADVPTTADAVDAYYRSLADRYRFRRGWLGAQVRTATGLLRLDGRADLRRLAADVALLASAVLAASALPRPSRRLNAIPAVADPLLTAVRCASLPLFALAQHRRASRRLRAALLGADAAAVVDAAASAAVVGRVDPVVE